MLRPILLGVAASAPAPALVAKRLLEGVLGHEVPPRCARFLDNATHSKPIWKYDIETLREDLSATRQSRTTSTTEGGHRER